MAHASIGKNSLKQNQEIQSIKRCSCTAYTTAFGCDKHDNSESKGHNSQPIMQFLNDAIADERHKEQQVLHHKKK